MSDRNREEIEKLESLYADNPAGRVFTHLAEAYRKAGETLRASQILDAGLPQHPDYPSAWVVLGRVKLDFGEKEEAASAFRRVLELDRHNLVALRALGDLAVEAGRFEEARHYLGELIQIDPADLETAERLEGLPDEEVSAMPIGYTEPVASDEFWSEASTTDSLDAGPETVPSTSATFEDEPEAVPTVAASVEDAPEAVPSDSVVVEIEPEAVAAEEPAVENVEELEASTADAAAPDRAVSPLDAWVESLDVLNPMLPISDPPDHAAAESAVPLPEPEAPEPRYEEPETESAGSEEATSLLEIDAVELEPEVVTLEAIDFDEEVGTTWDVDLGEAFADDAGGSESDYEYEIVIEPGDGIEELAEEPAIAGAAGQPGPEFEPEAASGAGDPEVEFEDASAAGEPEVEFEDVLAAVEPEVEFEDVLAAVEPDVEFEDASAAGEPETGSEGAPDAGEPVEIEADSRSAEDSTWLGDPAIHATAVPDPVEWVSQEDWERVAAYGAPSETGGGESGESVEAVPPIEADWGDADRDEDADEVATETLAEVYAAQGFRDEAAEIYRKLLRRRPDDSRLLSRLDAIEGESVEPAVQDQAGFETEEDGADAASEQAWVEKIESSWPGGEEPAIAGPTPYAWLDTGATVEPEEGDTVGDRLRSLLAWRPESSPEAAPEPTLLLDEVAAEPPLPDFPDLGSAGAGIGEAGQDPQDAESEDLEMFRSWLKSLRK